MLAAILRGEPASDQLSLPNSSAANRSGPAWYERALPMDGRATFLPFIDSLPGSVMNQRSAALPGIFASAVNAFTAPGRSFSDPNFDNASEAVNFATSMMGGGLSASRMAPAPKNALGMNVYHGSPHKFDKFDSSKIGTGEGAQAYGHGLYTAESKDLATVYRRKLTGVDGNSVTHPNESLQVKIGNLENEIKRLENSGDSAAPAMIRAYRNRIAELDQNGYLYKIDLPDEHIAKMLDYDNPISEAIRKPLSDAAMNQFGGGLTGTSGEKLYKEIIFNFKQAGHPNPTQAATDWLSGQGVPGMKYLDGGSRGSGVGTSNYVIFPKNEGLLKILERNGQSVKP